MITLYGTIFASTAAHARVIADLVRMAGGFARADGAARGALARHQHRAAGDAAGDLLLDRSASPVRMVVAGGLAQALMLPLIGAGGRLPAAHARVPEDLQPSPLTTAALWVSAIVMAAATIVHGRPAVRG